jgi:hypothetical protein
LPWQSHSFRQLITSVKVSPELAYKPRWTDRSPIFSGSNWGQVAAKAIGGAIGAAFVLLLLGLKRRKKDG